MALKIFELRWTIPEESEWISANTNIEAIKVYCKESGTELSDIDDTDEIVELPESEWDNNHLINTEYDENDPDDWQKRTFREWMDINNDTGIIGGTMYD